MVGCDDVGIVVPYFIEESGVIIIIYSVRYIHLIGNFLGAQLQPLQFEECNVCSFSNMDLHPHSWKIIVSVKGNIFRSIDLTEGPVRSSDLSP